MIFTLDIAALPVGYGEAVLPLALAKAHLHVLEDDDNDLIEALRDAAVEMVEQYTGLVLGPRLGGDALVWRSETMPRGTAAVSLGVRPVREIVSMTYLGIDGDEATIDVDGLRIVDQGSIALSPGIFWPSYAHGGVVVTFTAGLDEGAAPAPLLAAARMFLATLYRQRETVVTGTIVGELPHGFKMLCAPYRRLRV